MKSEPIPYPRQIFVCTNEKDGPCCGKANGDAIFKELRRIARERGLHPHVRVGQAKCLGRCTVGANVMVYPEKNMVFRSDLG